MQIHPIVSVKLEFAMPFTFRSFNGTIEFLKKIKDPISKKKMQFLFFFLKYAWKLFRIRSYAWKQNISFLALKREIDLKFFEIFFKNVLNIKKIYISEKTGYFNSGFVFYSVNV